ncbi:serine/threonine protein kinase, partial [Streptomyces sp. NPDC052196]
DHTTIALYATDSMSSSRSVSGMKQIATTTTKGTTADLKAKAGVKTRYVVLWLTAAPYAAGDGYSDPGFKQGITDVKFTG